MVLTIQITCSTTNIPSATSEFRTLLQAKGNNHSFSMELKTLYFPDDRCFIRQIKSSGNAFLKK